MVLCFWSMATVFRCNRDTDSVTGKVGDNRGGLTRRRWVLKHLVRCGTSISYFTANFSSHEDI